MAFTRINEENRIHINISHYADSILQEDIRKFHESTKSGFINKIINNYYTIADSSIHQRVTEYRSNLEDMFIDIIGTEKNEIINKLVENEICRLKNGIICEKGIGFKIRLNKECCEYLYCSNLCNENSYYDNQISLYVKALIEEYTRLSYAKREQIILNNIFEKIKQALNNEKVLSIIMYNEKKIKIRPYKIVSDVNNQYNYLVGYSKNDGNDICAYPIRLSNIKKIDELHEHSFISKEKKDALDELISKKGVQFLASQEEKFIVEFTKQGLKLYNSMYHLRPKYDEISPDGFTYTFSCTRNQFEVYFFKFGADAKVIAPTSTRKYFMKKYEQAMSVYTASD